MLKTSKDNGQPFPAFQAGVCICVTGQDKACVAKAVANSDRCSFHQNEAKYTTVYAEPTPSKEQSNAATRIAAALNAEPLDDPSVFRVSADVRGDEDEDEELHAAGTEPHADEISDDPPAGYEWREQLNAAGDDYERALVPSGTPQVHVIEPDRHHDDTELSAAYHTGRFAGFDYRWIHEDEKKNLLDRKNGFVPVKQSLDNRFQVKGGVVTLGDLVLAYRPKSVTEQRAREMLRTTATAMGEAQEFENMAAQTEHVSAFGSVTVSGENPRQMDPDEVRSARRRSEETPPPSRGRKQFAIPSLPWQRDKVAERHGAVGGS